MIKLKPNPLFPNGLIIVETRHCGTRTVWSVSNDDNFTETVKKAHRQSKREYPEFKLDIFDGCIEYLKEDLQNLTILSYEDLADELIKNKPLDNELLKECLFLDWVTVEENNV